MGVQVNTFRTVHKNALLDGKSVLVYCYGWLCKHGDESDRWSSYKTRARMLQSHINQASDRFSVIKPQYAIESDSKKDWNGAKVYTNLKSGVHYDTEPLSDTVVGFLKSYGHTWSILKDWYYDDSSMYAGHLVKKKVRADVVDGKVVTTYLSYTFPNGTVCTPAEFEAWRVPAVEQYAEACRKVREEQDRKNAEAAAEATRIRNEKITAADAQLAAAQEALNKAKQARAAIY